MAVWGLVKELRVAAEDTRPLVVSGPLAAQLEKELARGAAPGAVRVGGSAEDAAVLVRVLGGAPTDEDERVLRAAEAGGGPGRRRADRHRGLRRPVRARHRRRLCTPGRGLPGRGDRRARSRHGSARRGTGLAARLPVLREPLSER